MHQAGGVFGDGPGYPPFETATRARRIVVDQGRPGTLQRPRAGAYLGTDVGCAFLRKRQNIL